jgi:hypothetical protein
MVAANLRFKPILGFAKGACHDASIIDKGIQTTVVLLGKDLDKFLDGIQQRQIHGRKKRASDILGGDFALFLAAACEDHGRPMLNQMTPGLQTATAVLAPVTIIT